MSIVIISFTIRILLRKMHLPIEKRLIIIITIIITLIIMIMIIKM